jgi:hypothetical protein
MSTDGSRSRPDFIHLAELIQQIRVVKTELSGIIKHTRNSDITSRLIMASGLLDGALEELSMALSGRKD